MSEPISYRMLEALQARLQSISVANGYRTDIGQRVLIDAIYVPDDNAPAVFVIAQDFARKAGTSTPRQRDSDVEIIVEALMPITRDSAQREAHRVRADLLRALFDTAEDLPKDETGSAHSITISSDRIVTRPEGSNHIVVQITASAGLTERITPTPQP